MELYEISQYQNICTMNYHTKLYEISHRKFVKYLHVKILRNIIRNFTKYHTKLYKIPYETLQNITYRNLYVKILQNVTNVTLKICKMLRLEALRNITSKILRLHVKFYESTRIITKYYVYVILRWPQKLTKFFRAKFYANFRVKKFPDV